MAGVARGPSVPVAARDRRIRRRDLAAAGTRGVGQVKSRIGGEVEGDCVMMCDSRDHRLGTSVERDACGAVLPARLNGCG